MIVRAGASNVSRAACPASTARAQGNGVRGYGIFPAEPGLRTGRAPVTVPARGDR